MSKGNRSAAGEVAHEQLECAVFRVERREGAYLYVLVENEAVSESEVASESESEAVSES
ncbi:MAG: hypothetical protein HKO07_00440, partial [Pseudomonadales bacterium]|nr:hypothetical protein [Pseudomonadales bacterium]